MAETKSEAVMEGSGMWVSCRHGDGRVWEYDGLKSGGKGGQFELMEKLFYSSSWTHPHDYFTGERVLPPCSISMILMNR
jgi:hypothetical protein